MLHIEKAEYYADYKLKVTFNDGVTSIVDFEQTVFTDSLCLVQQLQDLKVFKDFRIHLHTIVWANGLDFAPEFIKSHSIKQLNETA